VSHGELQSIVVSIDGFGVVHSAGRAKGLGGGEQRFDRFVAQNDERSHRPETTGERFVAARVTDDRCGKRCACREAFSDRMRRGEDRTVHGGRCRGRPRERRHQRR
jgi:hypothetical protein